MKLRVALVCALLLAAPARAQEQAKPEPTKAVEGALATVAQHLSDPYALYLFESLTAQILYNENLLERANSPLAPKANDSLWALGIISDSILAEGEDGPYLNARQVPAFFEDIAHRYMNASHYWPDREITKDTRREHLSAWYSLYLMLLVANESQDQIAAKLLNGAFNLDPGMLEPGGPSLSDKLKRERVLSEDAYQAVHIGRAGPAGQEALTFPAYMDRWKARIDGAYAVSPSP